MNNCDRGETEIRGCLYFTVSRLFRLVNKVAEDSFSEMDICPTHGFLMVLLKDDEEGLTVNKISETLTIAPSTVTRFVDKLVAKGYVERVKNGKQSIAKITEKGLMIMPEIYSCWGSIFKKIENIVGDEEYLKDIAKRFLDFTDMVDKNLNDKY